MKKKIMRKNKEIGIRLGYAMQQQSFSSIAKYGDGHVYQPILHSEFKDSLLEHNGALCQGPISGVPGDGPCCPLR